MDKSRLVQGRRRPGIVAVLLVASLWKLVGLGAGDCYVPLLAPACWLFWL